MDAAARSSIADPSLAPEGEQRIRWVAKHSPVLNRLARERLADGALRGRRVAVVVHLEAKTAYLATLLADAGAHVVASGSNPGSTQDAICAALVARGIEVHARHGASPDEFDADLLAVADTEPEIVVDDGAELTARIVEHRPERRGRPRGRDRGDDDRRRAAADDGGGGEAHLPGDRRQRRALQAPVRQPLRHRPVDARGDRPAHEPELPRPRVLHRRLRLGRQGARPRGPRRRRPRHRRRDRPGRGARGAHGRPSRRLARAGAAGRRRAHRRDGRDRLRPGRGARAS